MPSPALLAYLFTHRLTDVRARLLGVRMPCDKAKIPSHHRYGVVLTAAALSLRERDAIRLELFDRERRVGSPVPAVRACLAKGAPSATGLEARIVTTLSATHWHETRRIVARLYERGRVVRRNVAHHLEESLLDEAVAAGCFAKPGSEPNCERITQLEPDFDRFHTRWESFRESEPELFETLVSDFTDGVERADPAVR